VSIKFAASLFDKILFITPMAATWYGDTFNIPKARIGVWPSSVDLKCFSLRSPQKVRELRENLSLSGQLVVLYHGSLSRARGISEAVEAFGILKKEGAKTTLILLGDGPLRQDLLQYVHNHELQDTVRIPDPVALTRVADYVAASDVEIVPVPDHPWWRHQDSIKILESLAMNKPLIASLRFMPTNKCLLGDAPVVLYLKGTSPRAIADGVTEFFATQHRLNPQLGRQIASRYSTDRVARMLEEYILCALASRKSEFSLTQTTRLHQTRVMEPE
jgi:glycosyltransferase involved in cell wall biosynthesis